MALVVRKRREPLPWWGSCLVFLGAVAVALAVGGALLALQGKPAWRGMGILLGSPAGSVWALEDCVLKAIPLFLCALGVGLSFRMAVWNIGAEGQFALGAVGATAVALTWGATLPALVLLPLMALAAMLAGGLWAMIAAALRVWCGASETIVTLMLNYIGILVLEFLVFGPWKDPASFGFPMTAEFAPAAVVPALPGTRIHWGVVICLVVGVLLSVVLRASRAGFEIAVCGQNPAAARYARIPYATWVSVVLVVGGALAGLAGFLEVSAALGRLQPSIMTGYGYTAIVVAWLSGLRSGSVAVVALFLAALRVGLESLQLDLQVPAAFGTMVEGTMLLMVLVGGFWTRYQIVRRSA